jgi:nicotinate phosphoribosyltransferase
MGKKLLTRRRKGGRAVAERDSLDAFAGLTIMASNDINESILTSLGQQGHEVDVFGIGTHLVTCQAQPALGCVYKLVALNGHPRIKLSDEVGKMTIPGRKEVYRLVGEMRHPLLDLMIEAGKPAPRAGERILCRHPLNEAKRAYVIPKGVVPLLTCVWDGRPTYTFPPLATIRDYVINQMGTMRADHMRAVNPTPYKVSVSEDLFRAIHEHLDAGGSHRGDKVDDLSGLPRCPEGLPFVEGAARRAFARRGGDASPKRLRFGCRRLPSRR